MIDIELNRKRHTYDKQLIPSRLYDSFSINANSLELYSCYYLCASKENINALCNQNNEVIFGRRGTGKTTLLKSFTYYINQKNQLINDNTACLYCDLSKLVPSYFPKDYTDNDILNYIVKRMLKLLSEFTIELHDRIDMVLPFDQVMESYKNVSLQVLKFDEIIEKGTISYDYSFGIKDETQEVENESGSAYNTGMHFSLKNIKAYLDMNLFNKKSKLNKSKISKSNKVSHVLDIGVLCENYELLLQYLGIKRLYICIDEFTNIDKYSACTLQPALAQFLKDMFFKIPQVTVKIASIWNQNKMQHRQFLSIRPGIEMGEDIRISSIRLDEMFAKDEKRSILFFKKMIGNAYLYNDYLKQIKGQDDKKSEHFTITLKEIFSEEEVVNYADMVIEDLFGKHIESFYHLICGSLGIPRVFVDTLIRCLDEIDIKKLDHITPGIVFYCIQDSYHNVARSKNPCMLSFFDAIENHIKKSGERVFIVDQDTYNDYINYFEGIVQNNALLQYPSSIVPIEIRNEYKVFAVHYGNYLEIIKEPKSTQGRGLIFPPLNDEEILNQVDKFLLIIPERAYYEVYCDQCHNRYDLRKFEGNRNIRTARFCPVCNKSISLWNSLWENN